MDAPIVAFRRRNEHLTLINSTTTEALLTKGKEEWMPSFLERVHRFLEEKGCRFQAEPNSTADHQYPPEYHGWKKVALAERPQGSRYPLFFYLYKGQWASINEMNEGIHFFRTGKKGFPECVMVYPSKEEAESNLFAHLEQERRGGLLKKKEGNV